MLTLDAPVAGAATPDQEFIFTNNWFRSRAKSAWDVLIPEVAPVRALEIGSFEGASTCYLISTCRPGAEMEIHCIDTWEGGEEHQGERVNMRQVEACFKHNTQLAKKRSAGRVSAVARKGLSSVRLAELIAEHRGESFDLIYVDGSHQAPDVLSDAVQAFHLLKVGGTMIFDDYLWNQGLEPLHTPKPAVDAFMNVYFQKMIVLNACRHGDVITQLPLYQLYTRKVAR